MDKIAVLIPCCNEGATIQKVIQDYQKELPEARIYVYDNNSSDGTAELASSFRDVTVRHEYQQGKGNVIRRMFREIDAQCYVMADGDDTYPAEYAREMAGKVLHHNADMVVGDRLSSTYFLENKRLFHNAGNAVVRKSINFLFRSDIRDIMTGYRAFSYEFAKTFPVLSRGFEIETEMSIHAIDKNMQVENVVIAYRDRPEGSESKLNTYSDGIRVLRMIFRLFRSYRPMAFYGSLSALLLSAAGIFLLPVFMDYLKTGMVDRFPTLIVCGFAAAAAVQSFFAGMVLANIAQQERRGFEAQLQRACRDKTEILRGGQKAMAGMSSRGIREVLKMDKHKLKECSWSSYDAFMAAVFSLCTVLMTRMQFSGSVWGMMDENYFSRFGFSSFLLFTACLPFYYWAIRKADPFMKAVLLKICPEEKAVRDRAGVLRFWAVLIVAAWIPYYLSYYPGGVYSDTFASISYSVDGILTNRHPLLYNFLIGTAVRCGAFFGKDLTWSMGLFLAVQMVLMEAEIIYFLHWMLVHNINRKVRISAMLFFVFFPLIPLYGVSIWKDTPFYMAVLLWVMFLTDLYLDIRKGRWNMAALAGTASGVFLVSFTRNNGVYAAALTVIGLVITTCRDKFQKKAAIYGTMLLTLAAAVFIQNPVYRWCGVSQTDTVESLGIPLQQIGSVVAYDGEITEEQKACINRFIPYENIKEHFSPCLADNLKWYAGLDYGYLSGHVGEFFELWMQLLVQNPQICIKEYLLETAGFWNVDVAAADAYVQNYMWGNAYGLSQTDLFEKWCGFSFRHFVDPRRYISCAWFFWIFFAACVFIMKHYGRRKIVLFLPQLGIWATLMAAVPVAVSLRYIAALLFSLPYAVLVPMLLEREALEKI